MFKKVTYEKEAQVANNEAELGMQVVSPHVCCAEFLRTPRPTLFLFLFFLVYSMALLYFLVHFFSLRTEKILNVRPSPKANMACKCRCLFQCVCWLCEGERREVGGMGDATKWPVTRKREWNSTCKWRQLLKCTYALTPSKTGVDYSEFKRISRSLVLIDSH